MGLPDFSLPWQRAGLLRGTEVPGPGSAASRFGTGLWFATEPQGGSGSFGILARPPGGSSIQIPFN